MNIADRLNELAKENLRTTLNQRQHSPSTKGFIALDAIIENLTQQAFNLADKGMYYLSSLDPGYGKSTTVIEWLKAFYAIEAKELERVGVLVCLNQYKQIQDYIKELDSSSYSIIADDKNPKGHDLTLQGLGKGQANKAKILFITQRQLDKLRHIPSFDALKMYHYRGKPRTVRVWDESLIVGRPLTINVYNLGKLFAPLYARDQELLRLVEKIYTETKGLPDRTTYEVPNLGITASQMFALIDDRKPDEMIDLVKSKRAKELRDITEDLCAMSGRLVSIVNTRSGIYLEDGDEKLPNDFTPCLILDASGRLRKTYDLQDSGRKNLIRLPEVYKDYSNLSFHIWNHASGRIHYSKYGNIKRIADEIQVLVNSKPKTKFLIVCFKPRHLWGYDNLQKELLGKINGDPERVKFLTWGAHTATNDFREYDHVIIASVLQQDVATYRANMRAASGKTSAKGFFTPSEEGKFKQGEIAHEIFQAICRCVVRGLNGEDQCYAADVYLITPTITGVKALLPEIFPSCHIHTWETSNKDKELSGNAKTAFQLLIKAFKDGRDEVPAKELSKAMGIRTQNFTRDVLRNVEFIEEISKNDIATTHKGNKGMFFIKVNHELITNI